MLWGSGSGSKFRTEGFVGLELRGREEALRIDSRTGLRVSGLGFWSLELKLVYGLRSHGRLKGFPNVGFKA